MLPELSALLAVLGLTAAAATAGWPLRRAFPASLLAPERAALQILAGFGLLGLFFFLTGMRVFSAWTVGVTLAVLLPAGASIAWRERIRVRFGLPRWPYLVTSGILLIRLIAACDLPSGTSDEISYHLFGPKMWLLTGSVRPVLEHSHTAFPATVEMLFGSVMAISNDRAPGMLTVVFAVLLLTLTWGLVRRPGAGEKTASLCVVLAATTPVILTRVATGFIDCAFTAFALAAARILLELPEGWSLVAGALFAGFAAGTKYTGLIVVATLGALFLAPAFRLLRAVQVWAIALLVCCPWYIRNFIVLGSPVYPPPLSIAKYFTARAMPPDAIREFNTYIMTWGGASFGRSPLDFLLLPFRLTFEAQAFGGFAGGEGLAMLAFAPLGLWLLRRSGYAMRLFIWAMLLAVAWFLTQQEVRFLIPVLVVFTVFAAFGAEGALAQPSRAGRVLAIAALAVTIAHGGLLAVTEPMERVTAVMKGRGGDRYDPARVEGAAVFEFLNTHPEVKRVLVVGRHFKPYYLDKPFVTVRGEHGEMPDASMPDGAAALRRLRELNVTHVVDWPTHDEAPLDVEGAPLDLVMRDGAARIYRVRPSF